MIGPRSSLANAFGAFGFAILLAYVGSLLFSNAEHGTAFRVLAGVTLGLGALACLEKAIRELRGTRSR